MIKRIKYIKGVGRFINTGNTELAQATLIYGPNCYGKSTLSDIFRSLESRSVDVIHQRKSIRSDGVQTDQRIGFTYIAEPDASEQQITFDGENWHTGDFSYSIEVFDSRFIEDNVFTGLAIKRGNKENLTNLLIGKESADIGKKIESLKKASLPEKRKEIGQIEDLLEMKLETLELAITLEDFIKYKKPDDIDAVKAEMVKLLENQKKTKRSIDEKGKILALDIPQTIVFDDPMQVVKSMENHLGAGFEDINASAYERMREHIDQHFAISDGEEEEWIKKGLRIYVGEENEFESQRCPFCSQKLEHVKELIETYNKVFSEEYEKFIIENSLSSKEEFENLTKIIDNLKAMSNLIANNSATYRKWADYLSAASKPAIEELDGFGSNTMNEVEKLLKLIIQCAEQFALIIEQKRKKPFEPIAVELKYDDLSNVYASLNAIMSQYNSSIDLLVGEISDLKAKTRGEEITKALDTLKEKIDVLTVLIKRYELSPDVDKLLLLRQERKVIVEKLDELQVILEQKNKQFMDENYKEITRIFNSLGSRDFEIVHNFVKRGNQPVYEPVVRFAGEEITSDRLSYVFSDADRRALAFAIFVAKLYKKSKAELLKTIVVLDDVVTSFDDNRKSKSLIIIKELSIKCQQLIIAGHNSGFLLEMHDLLKDNPELQVKFTEIKRDGFGSIIRQMQNPKTELDPNTRDFEKIERFIIGDVGISGSETRQLLRPTLQKELEWRFRRHLKGETYSGLGALTDRLKEKRSINDAIAEKIYGFNFVLRKVHHRSVSEMDEDTRNIAEELMQFLFVELNPDINKT